MMTEIEKLAYEMWEKDGRPHGRDQEYYFAAERMLAARQDSSVAVAEAPVKKRAPRATSDKPKTTRTKKQA